MASKAALVNRISTPKHPKRAWYCDTKEPFTSVRIRRRSGTVSGESVVIEGSRDINSGMKLGKRQSGSQIGGDSAHPNLMRSTVSRWSRTSADLRFEVKNGSCLDKSNDWDLKFAVNPIDYIFHSIMEQIHASEPTHAFSYALFDNSIKANKCSTEYEQNI